MKFTLNYLPFFNHFDTLDLPYCIMHYVCIREKQKQKEISKCVILYKIDT
jgi:hypothetical protein